MERALPPAPAPHPAPHSSAPGPTPIATHARAAEGFDLQQYWHVLRKRKIAIAATALIVVASAVIATLLMNPLYRAVATIQIERENPNILSFQEILQVDSRQDDFYQTQYMLLQSRSLIRRVVEQGKLWQQPEFAKELKALPATGRTSESGWDLRLVDLLQRRIHVLPVRRSRLVKIAVDTHDPQLSAAVANGVASAYIDSNLENKFETTEAATQFLSTQIESLKREVEESKKRLQAYAEKSQLLSLDDKQNITVQRLTDLNESFTRAQADRIEAETGFRALLGALGLRDIPVGLAEKSVAPAQLDLGRVPEVAANQLVQNLRAAHAALQTRYTEMALRFKADWPEMVRVKEQLQDLGGQIRGEEWRIVAGLLKRSESDYRAALGREQMLERELEGQKQNVSEMNSSAILFNTLKSEIDTKSQLLDSLLKRKNETDVSARLRGLKSSNIRVVDEAEPPQRAFRPDKKVNTILAMLVGILMGIGVAFLLEYLDNTIKSVSDVERVTGLPSLGVIPLFAPAAVPRQLADGVAAKAGAGGAVEASQQLVTLSETRSAVSEAYRSLRTSILLSAAGSPPRFLLVTSSQPSEGKTTTVVNTAIALAQAGKKVLLIDADLRKPRCHRLLGLPNNVGLTTFLTGAADLKTLIQPAAVKNLFVLTSGPIPPNPSELLGSMRIRDLMASIPPAVDHILFDSPPILTVTDATLLAALVDGVVLVVRAGHSPREIVRRSRRQLADVNAKVVGVVLNSVDAKHSDYYYYSYAYSSYGYGDEAAG